MVDTVTISRREAFSFTLARKLLAHYKATPLHLDMRSVLDKIAESLEGEVTIEPDASTWEACPRGPGADRSRSLGAAGVVHRAEGGSPGHILVGDGRHGTGIPLPVPAGVREQTVDIGVPVGQPAEGLWDQHSALEEVAATGRLVQEGGEDHIHHLPAVVL